eukprot:1235540-Amphidinium_carterae.3
MVYGCCESSCGPMADEENELLILDGGSDEHCEPPSKVKLRDAQHHCIPLDGERRVGLALEGGGSGAATVQIGNFARNLLSVGKVDNEFELHFREQKSYMLNPDGPATVMRFRPRGLESYNGNTFGIIAKVMDGVVCAVGDTIEAQAVLDPETSVHDDDPRARSSIEEMALDGLALIAGACCQVAESTHGTKDVLWSRLKRSEKILKEKMELKNTFRMRQQAHIN